MPRFRNEGMAGSNLQNVNWNQAELIPFQKNFYIVDTLDFIFRLNVNRKIQLSKKDLKKRLMIIAILIKSQSEVLTLQDLSSLLKKRNSQVILVNNLRANLKHHLRFKAKDGLLL